jgi:hypothetical protein
VHRYFYGESIIHHTLIKRLGCSSRHRSRGAAAEDPNRITLGVRL